jgi:hypothetical protein
LNKPQFIRRGKMRCEQLSTQQPVVHFSARKS